MKRCATSEIGKDGVELSIYLYDYDACASKGAPQPPSFIQLGFHLYGQGPAPAPGTYAMAPTPARTTSVSSDGTASGTFDIVLSNTVDSPPSSSTSGSYHETGSFQGATHRR
jgi:hypothetical protein